MGSVCKRSVSDVCLFHVCMFTKLCKAFYVLVKFKALSWFPSDIHCMAIGSNFVVAEFAENFLKGYSYSLL